MAFGQESNYCFDPGFLNREPESRAYPTVSANMRLRLHVLQNSAKVILDIGHTLQVIRRTEL